MSTKDITETEKLAYNAVVSHPLQSYEWGEFRKKTGVTVIKKGIYENEKLTSGFQLTIHRIPHTPWTIGYLPKGNLPDKNLVEELKAVGKKYRCVFIQLEPNVIAKPSSSFQLTSLHFAASVHPLFTKYTLQLDITKSEEELLKNMHPKTRYNIRVAQKHNVEIAEDSSEKAFKEYLRLTNETTKRQGFYAHTPTYHTLMWETLRPNMSSGARAAARSQQSAGEDGRLKMEDPELSAHLLTARYKEKILTTWILFIFKDTLYYPYGASSNENRETMASNLLMWEAIRFGKKHNLKVFDMWGALGPTPDAKDPWFGFHRFKTGYGPTLVEFVGSYDLVLNNTLYQLYKGANVIRWLLLKRKR